jgi:hypothetical protein
MSPSPTLTHDEWALVAEALVMSMDVLREDGDDYSEYAALLAKVQEGAEI